MAVSIEDAWNISSVIQPQVQPQVQLTKTRDEVNMNGISSKQTYTPTLSAEQELGYNAMLTPQDTPTEEKYISENNKYMESVVMQLQELRKEESKRFTVYLTLSGVLFALLFMYIERLQNKIAGLSQHIRRVPVMQKPPSHDMRPPPSELYSWIQQ